MKRKILTIIVLCWVASFATTKAAVIVNNSGTSAEDSLVVSVINWDSAGLAPVSADSFWVVIVKSDMNDAVFTDSGTTSMIGLDSVQSAGKTIYYYHRAVGDVDGDGSVGHYHGELIARNTALGLFGVADFEFQVVGWELDDLGDSAACAARLYDSLITQGEILDSLYAVLDSLQNHDEWVSSYDASSESVMLGVDDFSELADTLYGRDSSLYAEGFWHKIANRADSGAVGSGVDSASIAAAVWNTPQANHTAAGTFGKYLDSEISGIGSGSGVYSCMLVAYDSTVAQVIPNATVVIRNLQQTSLVALGKTDTNGEVDLNLDEGDYLAVVSASGYLFEPFDTISIASDAVDTVFGDQFDPGSPSSPNLCRVYGFLGDVQGVSQEGAALTAYLPSGIVRHGETIVSPSTVSTSTNEDGYFFLDLIPSDQLTPSGTMYEFCLTRQDGTILRQRLAVPDSTAWLLSW